MAIYSGSGNLTGSASGDILVSTNPVEPTPPTHLVLLGGDGDDAIVFSHGPIINETASGNGSFASALNIDAAGLWAIGDNPLVGDPARPTATVLGSVAFRSSDYFTFSAGSSQSISLDVDFAQRYGDGVNAKLTLYDSAMNVLASSDDSSATGGGEGSDPGGLDPTLYYVARYTGAYYVRVSPSSTFGADTGDYLLNVSVTGHAATGASSTLGESADGQNGDDYLVGGNGGDQLFGSDGSDTLYGNGGSDGLHGGAGDDILNGGDGIDGIDYAAALGGVTVDLSLTSAQNTGGDGTDTIIAVENLYGSDFNDTLRGNNAPNALYGGKGDDVMNGGGSDDRITVGLGHDTVDGGSTGYDTLVFGAQGEWTIDLRSGHAQMGADSVDFVNFDAVVGSYGSDTIYAVADRDVAGGANPDYIYAAGGQSALDGGEFTTSVHGGDTVDTTLMLTAGQSIVVNLANGLTSMAGLFFTDFDNYVGGAADDDVTGSVSANTIRTGAGDDTIHAGDGYDQLYVGLGADSVYGEDGNDTLHILAVGEISAGDAVDGGVGADTLSIETGVDTDISTLALSSVENIVVTGGHALSLAAAQVSGPGQLIAGSVTFTTAGALDLGGFYIGTATIRLADQATIIDLTGSNDTGVLAVYGGSGDDRITGNSVGSGDTLDGGGGSDRLTGGDLGDILIGGAGADRMAGGLGDDQYQVDSAKDRIIEKAVAGHDTVTATVSYTLEGGVEDLVLGGGGAFSGTGNAADNTLTGNSAGNVLSGLDGDDRLDGHEGADHLNGGTVKDVLIGGSGADRLTGGGGADLFVFADSVGSMKPGGWGRDEIADFAQGLDHIDLTGASAIHKFRDLAVTDDGGDAVISTGHGDTIRLDGVAASSLKASDFIFAPAAAAPVAADHPFLDHQTPAWPGGAHVWLA